MYGRATGHIKKAMKIKGINKLILVAALLCCGTTQVLAQQNIQFTQYIFNSLSVNPAYAGYKEEWFAQMALRSQWTGIQGAPRTGQISIDGVLDPYTKRMGLGLQITADKLGPQSANSAYVNYAYRIRLDDEDTRRLSFGVGVGLTQYGLDGSMLNPVDGGDQSLPVGKISNIIPDARFGVYYSSPKFYIGASVMDLFSKSYDNAIFRWSDGSNENIRRQRHMYLITGMLVDLNEDTKLRPSIMVKEDFKGPTSLDVGAMVIFGGKVWFGGAYRTGVKTWNKKYTDGQDLSQLNAISGIAQFYVDKRFRIGYSYDYALSKLGSISNGTHEITLGMTFPRKDIRLLSPRFF